MATAISESADAVLTNDLALARATELLVDQLATLL